MSKLLHHRIVRQPGTADWVVFVHGAGGSIQTWKYQTDRFATYYNVLLIDLRDHGQSKNMHPPIEQYTFEHISADILRVMDEVGIHRAHFVTLSFGSVLMQDFAFRYPGRVGKVVFAGGIFKGTWAIRSFVHFARVLNTFIGYQKMYSLFSYLLMPRDRNQKARRLYQLQARKLSQKEYMKWVGLYDEFFQLLASFFYTPLTQPSLIIMGGDDFVFLRGARQFTQVQPQASLFILPRTGHICNVENAELFNQQALDFLEGGGSSARKPMTTERYAPN